MAVFYFEWHFNIIESKVFMLGLKTKYAFIIGAIIILSTSLIFRRKIIFDNRTKIRANKKNIIAIE